MSQPWLHSGYGEAFTKDLRKAANCHSFHTFQKCYKLLLVASVVTTFDCLLLRDVVHQLVGGDIRRSDLFPIGTFSPSVLPSFPDEMPWFCVIVFHSSLWVTLLYRWILHRKCNGDKNTVLHLLIAFVASCVHLQMILCPAIQTPLPKAGRWVRWW